jgi:hypothetical protein
MSCETSSGGYFVCENVKSLDIGQETEGGSKRRAVAKSLLRTVLNFEYIFD